MVTKRIIPCLDIKNGRTVKGVNFVNLRDAGDPVELAAQYATEGADELVFLDISATLEERETIYELVRRVAEKVNIPFTVGGGISSVDKVSRLLQNGADKVSVNSAVVRRPEVATEIAAEFGVQVLVVAIDGRQVDGRWLVHTHGGTRPTDLDVFDWAYKMQEMGAGEILFTSMDHDGTKQGFACEALAKMSDLLTIPVIASGGAGSEEHFMDAFTVGKADAALAASIFHFGEIPIPSLKSYLREKDIFIR
ncbi:MAG: imidazole glycerol phosphate synthase subunit HisF [Bacteroidota bacterium]